MSDPTTNVDATETACSCCGESDEENDTNERFHYRWGTESPTIDATLPAEVRTTLGRFLGEDSIETLGDWIEECRRRTGGGPIAVEDLCHASEETSHWGEIEAERYHFLCFYDAVVLSALVDEPVDIHTESPDGTVIEAHAVGTDELSVTPETAVFSFGIGQDVEPPSEVVPGLEDVYSAVCPYVRAFPNREAYERWAKTVPAVTVALPPEDATEMATRLVE